MSSSIQEIQVAVVNTITDGKYNDDSQAKSYASYTDKLQQVDSIDMCDIKKKLSIRNILFMHHIYLNN